MIRRTLRKIGAAARAYFATLNMSPQAYRVVHTLESRERAAGPGKSTPPWVHVLLFVITLGTTTMAGFSMDGTLSSAVSFSLSIMTILLAHEMGHYLAARRFGVRTTLPYFIPFPSIVGTMGAVIKIKSPITDTRALLYIGAMGPVVGFVLSLAASAYGISVSPIVPLPSGGEGEVLIFGDSLLVRGLTLAIHGHIPAGYDILLSPVAFAGWIGFLITSLNLMPMGQLDGSHILYALIGRAQLYFGWAVFLALAGLSFIWPGWIVWVLMALFFLMVGHPPVPGGRELSAGEKLLGWCCVGIFILTFIPVPIDFI
ncbi:MAG: site-2 protease family protein [Spirochaetes bacterium]|nr:MAG: site-2 protease family protein [Spirochaetota bacterium]